MRKAITFALPNKKGVVLKSKNWVKRWRRFKIYFRFIDIKFGQINMDRYFCTPIKSGGK